MKVGFYAGSFDPFTVGHLHLVKTASGLFDKVIVGIGVNSKKIRKFNCETMKNAIENTLKKEGVLNVECVIYDSLTADAAKERGADFLIRGIRNGIDYDYEENMALINQEIAGIDTIYVRAGKFGAVSSSVVKELLENNKDVSKFVPEDVLKIIQN